MLSVSLRAAAALAAIAILACPAVPAHAAKVGLCKFDTVQYTFQGTAIEQARCLLRFVKYKGTGSTPQDIPAWLGTRVGQPVDVTPAAFKAMLVRDHVPEGEVGGPIPAAPDVSARRYFVIHDTSSPEISGTSASAFPPNINESSWSANSMNGWTDTAKRVNVITNRVGGSRTLRDLTASRPKPATKLEQDNLYAAAKKHFVHVENIQPRVVPPGDWGHIAPQPGFPKPQIERLALIYIAASVRAGRWLVPAFHFNIDDQLGTSNGHDDPQNFVLADWVAAVEAAATRAATGQ